jgi:hypothetical protein
MHPQLIYLIVRERSADLQRAALLRSARSINQGGPQCR